MIPEPTGFAPCAMCDGRCCRVHTIELWGGDVFRLVGGVGLRPADFVSFAPVPDDDSGVTAASFNAANSSTKSFSNAPKASVITSIVTAVSSRPRP